MAMAIKRPRGSLTPRIAVCACALSLVTSCAHGPAVSDLGLPSKCGSGWARRKRVREYGPSNLHKYNDGAAAAYIAYGFEKLRTTQYAKAGIAMVVDVFDMGTAKNAFGMYSTMRSPDDSFVAVGNQGVILEAVLDFWQGCYLVHVAPAAADPVDDANALELGRAVAGRLGDKGASVPELAQFPRRGLVPNSILYARQNLLGLAVLRNGFLAQYEIAGNEAQALFADYASADESLAALNSLRSFIDSKGRAGPLRPRGGRHTFAGRHPRFKNVFFAAEGHRLAGVLSGGELHSEARAELLDGLLAGGR